MSENNLIITPKTKVFDLLETYPQLEEKLIGLAPAFQRLKNPVLRKTIARISTLQQVAAIGNLKIDELINLLRKEVGQENFTEKNFSGPALNYLKPEWFNKEKVSTFLDVRPMLEAGEHPIHQVMADLNTLPNSEIYKMTASFVPVPLIEKASSFGCKHWVEKISENEFDIYFIKN